MSNSTKAFGHGRRSSRPGCSSAGRSAAPWTRAPLRAGHRVRGQGAALQLLLATTARSWPSGSSAPERTIALATGAVDALGPDGRRDRAVRDPGDQGTCRSRPRTWSGRALGLSDEEILDVVLAVAARCFFSTVLEALGVQADPAHRALDPKLRAALTVGRPIEGG